MSSQASKKSLKSTINCDKLNIKKREELEKENRNVIKDLANQIIDYKKTIADLDNRLGLKYPPIV